ncbi:extracellular solute-binding protein [Chelatococcus sp. SYSU_G07232]|uniref:Extracellular solute-binding protein n=1 Tax=Chelatococcus albus TaxID=3047466 RepID=A0ABT7ABY8_9HYPH|nr:extracellular solute-binding protein [Chelatococcus sp. SYSU_G07232]MDJ1156875.1 extracellular solute-binding protein [Chelatococcus sp. SYSU_G07232]
MTAACRSIRPYALLVAAALSWLAVPLAHAAEGAARHAIVKHGEPALPAGFTHFPYVNVAAPKGGRLVQSVLGTYDNLNPFVLKGISAQGLTNLVFQSLMARSMDEPFSLYPSIAESVELPEDRSFILFHLDVRARFSDGRPITAEDVLFSWSLLKEKGKPFHRAYYGKVAKATALDARTVRFDLADTSDREIPLVLAMMPVLAEGTIDPETFETETYKVPVGSGPYVVAEFEAGKSITYRRNPNFWAADLPVNRGLYNFDEIRFDYYRDVNTQFEAFKAGLYDLRVEQSAARWATAYDFPAVAEGRVIREELPVGTPKPMSGFAFNTRRTQFSDVRVREALGYLFDFEWVNRNLFFGLYKRTASYFAGSDLSSFGRPASPRERALLAPFGDAVRGDILEGTWSPPASDGSGRDRGLARKAFELMEAAGFELADGLLRRKASGEPLSFEIMVASRDQERLALNFAQSLARAGITARVRLVDEAQYWRRLQSFDYDMILYTWNVSASPGNEQENRWNMASADRQGSLNYTGAKSPAIDAMIAAMLSARTRDDYVAAVRAFDRVLLSGFYVVPLFHAPSQWVAHWSTISRPETTPLFGTQPESWWRAGS